MQKLCKRLFIFRLRNIRKEIEFSNCAMTIDRVCNYEKHSISKLLQSLANHVAFFLSILELGNARTKLNGTLLMHGGQLKA